MGVQTRGRARSGGERLAAGFQVETRVEDGNTVVPATIRGADAIVSSGSITVALLGELYGDTLDTVLQRYRSEGLSGLTGLHGSFLLVVDDRRDNETWLLNDHIGSRAAYLWELPDLRLVTNQVGHGPRELVDVDPGGVASYLAADGVRAGLTPYRQVRAVQPGSIVSLRRGTSNRYWSLRPDPQPGEADELAGEMINLMRRSVERRLQASPNRKVMLSLSGGVDSKGLLGLLLEAVGPEGLEAFTYYYGQQVGDMDLPEARAVAKRLGIAHRSVVGFRGDFFSTLVDNALRGDSVAHFCDDADVWSQLAAELGNHSLLVVGDRQAHQLSSLPDDLSTDALLRLVSFHSSEGIGWFLDRLPEEQREAMKSEWEEAYQSVADELAAYPSWKEAVHPAYLENRANPTLTLWRERFCSRLGPVANPFLDRDLLDFIGRVPTDLHDGSGTMLHRIALERAYPDIFSGYATGGGWNVPDWGNEIARNSQSLSQMIRTIDSPLEALVPKEVTLSLIDEVARGPRPVSTATSGWRWQVRRTVKAVPPLTKLIRTAKLRTKTASAPKVGSAAMLRRLLTLHLAMADHNDVHEFTDGRTL